MSGLFSGETIIRDNRVPEGHIGFNGPDGLVLIKLSEFVFPEEPDIVDALAKQIRESNPFIQLSVPWDKCDKRGYLNTARYILERFDVREK